MAGAHVVRHHHFPLLEASRLFGKATLADEGFSFLPRCANRRRGGAAAKTRHRPHFPLSRPLSPPEAPFPGSVPVGASLSFSTFFTGRLHFSITDSLSAD